MKSAGIVKMVPDASDELAEPMVCDRLASSSIPRPPPSTRKSATVSTAIGIEVETVRPTRRPRYALAAPKSRPRTRPATTARSVNSTGDSSACDGVVLVTCPPRSLVEGRIIQSRYS
jgi:hypothetical protein